MTSSNGERRKQKISQGSLSQKDVVNTRGTARVQSSHTARVMKQTCGAEYSLMDKVLKHSNLVAALSRVKKNKGAAGVDGVEVKSLPDYLNAHWPRICDELLKGTYRPLPVRRIEIPKPDGGKRMLGIPTVVDRFIQQALLQVLNEIFDPYFSPSSFGFRPGRGTQQAIAQAKKYIEEGHKYVVDMDLEKFFDRVNHDILMSRVARKVKDKRVLKLIRSYLNAGAMENGVKVRTEEGTPQGGPLSPLLANILLDDLDKELERRGHKFARYADDCNIYVKSRRAGERVMAGVRDFLEDRLKLKVNASKSAVDSPKKRKFLGISFWHDRKGQPIVRLASKSVERFKAKIRQLTKRNVSISMHNRIAKLNEYLRGWMAYFRIAQTPSVFAGLDEWIRRRLRMCYLKQWKKPRTKFNNLVKLGIKPEEARNISGSRKGYWRLALTPQLNKALGLAFWRNQGLISLADEYDKHRSTS